MGGGREGGIGYLFTSLGDRVPCATCCAAAFVPRHHAATTVAATPTTLPRRTTTATATSATATAASNAMVSSTNAYTCLPASLPTNHRTVLCCRYGRVIHEFDPWFNYRAAEYLVDNGYTAFFNW